MKIMKIEWTWQKLVELTCYLFSIFCFLFIIIFNGAYWGTNPPSTIIDTLGIILGVFIPLETGIITIFVAKTIHVQTWKDDINAANKLKQKQIVDSHLHEMIIEHIIQNEVKRREGRADFYDRLKAVDEKVKIMEVEHE